MTTPAGWYPDPTDSAALRYFDGAAWTTHTQPAAGPAPVAEAVEPPTAQPPHPEPAAEPASAAPASAPPADPYGTFTLGSREVLASEPAPGRGRLKKGLAVGAASLAVLGVAGGAYAFSTLSGGGAQPETALPASAVAYAEIDLDPAASQKLAVYRLAKKFPKTEVDGEDSVRDDLLSEALSDTLPEGRSYEKDIAPWVGDRAGVAVLGQLDEEQQPQVAIAVQYDDEGSAKEHLSELAGEGFGYAFGADGYVVLAETTALAQKVVADAEKAPLSGSARYNDAVDALGGDQIGLAYLDAKAVYDVLPQELRDSYADNPLAGKGATPSGQVVVGVSAASDHLDVRGRLLDLELGTTEPGLVGGRPGSGLLQRMPKDTVAGLSITDAGKDLAKAYTSITGAASDVGEKAGFGSDLFGFQDALDQYGLDLPADIERVFGTDLAVAATGEAPDVVARVRGGDPARALEIVRKVDETGESERLLREDGGDLVVGSTPEALETVTADGGLGKTEAFREALPEADGAGLALFVDVQRALAAFGGDGDLDAEDREDLAPLEAVGLTTQGGSDGRFLFRLTFR